MADNIMLNVQEGFDLKKLTEQLADMYRAKGFTVNASSLNDSEVLIFDKGIGGINMLLGMDLGIKATFSVQNNTLVVTLSEAAWTGKIIGLSVGCLFVLFRFLQPHTELLSKASFQKICVMI